MWWGILSCTLHCSLGPDRYVAWQVALHGSHQSCISMPWSGDWGAELMVGRCEMTSASLLFSSIRWCSLLLLNYNCSSVWWGRNLASKQEVFAKDWRLMRRLSVFRRVRPFHKLTWSLGTECSKWVYSFVPGHIPSCSEACVACTPWFRHGWQVFCEVEHEMDLLAGRHLNRCLPLARDPLISSFRLRSHVRGVWPPTTTSPACWGSLSLRKTGI